MAGTSVICVARTGRCCTATRSASPMISSCRSTAERRRASAASSSKLLPLVKSDNRAQATRISNNHALGSRGIQQLARRPYNASDSVRRPRYASPRSGNGISSNSTSNSMSLDYSSNSSPAAEAKTSRRRTRCFWHKATSCSRRTISVAVIAGIVPDVVRLLLGIDKDTLNRHRLRKPDLLQLVHGTHGRCDGQHVASTLGQPAVELLQRGRLACRRRRAD